MTQPRSVDCVDGFWCEREAPTASELEADKAAARARGEQWSHVVAPPPLDPYQPGVRGLVVGEARAFVAEPDGREGVVTVVRAMWRSARQTLWFDAQTVGEALDGLAIERQRWGCDSAEPERYPGEPVPSARH